MHMESRNIFNNISPLDHRYYLANREIFDELSKYLSEDAGIRYCIIAEAALLKTHIKLHLGGSSRLNNAADSLVSGITSDEVYKEEAVTHHNIRALVNVIKRKVPDVLKPYVHMGATSVDILDTASSLRFRDAVRKVVLPILLDVEELLAEISGNEAETPQVGRTHGQHAVPITLGFAFAEYVSRLGKSISRIEELSSGLKGKLAGAVGAYNSASMIVKEPEEMERIYLDFLGIGASEHSTQMVEPEYLLRLLLEINVAFGIIANLADDLRHLQRSEISELQELFTADQVGSSTMPQKRNPWNSEHVKSLWKAFSPRVMTFYMDQISEHQRDLSNSASSRFIADYIAGFTAALNRIKRVLSTLHVKRDILERNLSYTGDLVLSEAAYILLSSAGDPEAHEKIRLITLECEKSGKNMAEQMKEDPELWKLVSEQLMKIRGLDADVFFSNPQMYRGRAAEKARTISKKYISEISRIRGVL